MGVIDAPDFLEFSFGNLEISFRLYIQDKHRIANISSPRNKFSEIWNYNTFNFWIFFHFFLIFRFLMKHLDSKKMLRFYDFMLFTKKRLKVYKKKIEILHKKSWKFTKKVKNLQKIQKNIVLEIIFFLIIVFSKIKHWNFVLNFYWY